MVKKLRPLLLLLLPILTACAKGDQPAAPDISANAYFLSENYGRAGLVITACSSDAQANRRPPESLRIRANMMDTDAWSAKRGITFDQPQAYIDAPDLIGVEQWGRAMRGAQGWHEASAGCYERIIEGAFNAVREWDNAGACPVTTFSLQLNWGGRRLETDLPCVTPLSIVFPSEQLPPLEEK